MKHIKKHARTLAIITYSLFTALVVNAGVLTGNYLQFRTYEYPKYKALYIAEHSYNPLDNMCHA